VTSDPILAGDASLPDRSDRAVVEVIDLLMGRDVLVTHEPDIATYCSRRVAFLDGLVVSDRPQAPASAAAALAAWQSDSQTAVSA